MYSLKIVFEKHKGTFFDHVYIILNNHFQKISFFKLLKIKITIVEMY